MVVMNDDDRTGHFVPVRRLPPGLLFSWLPLYNLLFGDAQTPVEVASLVKNGSVVVGIGDRDKSYYIVQTPDIVHAAYKADQALRRDKNIQVIGANIPQIDQILSGKR